MIRIATHMTNLAVTHRDQHTTGVITITRTRRTNQTITRRPSHQSDSIAREDHKPPSLLPTTCGVATPHSVGFDSGNPYRTSSARLERFSFWTTCDRRPRPDRASTGARRPTTSASSSTTSTARPHRASPPRRRTGSRSRPARATPTPASPPVRTTTRSTAEDAAGNVGAPQ